MRRVGLERVGDDVGDRLVQTKLQRMRGFGRQRQRYGKFVNPRNDPRDLCAVVAQHQGVAFAHRKLVTVQACAEAAATAASLSR